MARPARLGPSNRSKGGNMAKTAAVSKGKRSAAAPSGELEKNGDERPSTNGKELEQRPDRALARLEQALQAAAAGDFGVRLPARRKDAIGPLEAAYNELAARNAALEAELVRVAQIIGREGRMTERARLRRRRRRVEHDRSTRSTG